MREDCIMTTLQLSRTLLLSVALLAAGSFAAQAQTAKAELKTAEGRDAGSVTLTQTPNGVLLNLSLKGVPAGEHAFHVHETGKCEPPFATAGGHFNPGGKKHGHDAAEGPHAGDMPNLHVPASGDLDAEVLNAAITLEKGKPNSVFKDGGTAIVVHAGKDDYKTDPAGNAGGRIVCGVIN